MDRFLTTAEMACGNHVGSCETKYSSTELIFGSSSISDSSCKCHNRAQCGREQRAHPRRLAYSSDCSQWLALVNNIPTLASRLNGLSIANVAASSHSYDLNSRRCAVKRRRGLQAAPEEVREPPEHAGGRRPAPRTALNA